VDPRAIVRLEGLGQLKKSNKVIGNQTHDLLACSTVPQPTMLPRAPRVNLILAILIIYVCNVSLLLAESKVVLSYFVVKKKCETYICIEPQLHLIEKYHGPQPH
jgi:hypothetical protein